ncbi:hypothetical protein FPL09_09130 [Spiribacter vilamensis]|nr:hypothetical protein FPL09_09130 [Spiribacter vilamensis]
MKPRPLRKAVVGSREAPPSPSPSPSPPSPSPPATEAPSCSPSPSAWASSMVGSSGVSAMSPTGAADTVPLTATAARPPMIRRA